MLFKKKKTLLFELKRTDVLGLGIQFSLVGNTITEIRWARKKIGFMFGILAIKN